MERLYSDVLRMRNSRAGYISRLRVTVTGGECCACAIQSAAHAQYRAPYMCHIVTETAEKRKIITDFSSQCCGYFSSRARFHLKGKISVISFIVFTEKQTKNKLSYAR